MGLKTLTAIEIGSNARDLLITVSGKLPGKFSFLISRGLRHRYKPLLSTTPFFASFEEAVAEIETIFNLSRQEVEPVMEAGDPNFLSNEMIEWALKELREKKEVDTSTAPSTFAKV